MGTKLYIKTFGCQMNEYDSQKTADILKNEIIESIKNLTSRTIEERRKLRNEKFLSMTSEI